MGDTPDSAAIRTGVPFTGQIGELLGRAFNSLGIKRNRVWLTNTALCHRHGVDDKVRLAASEACRPRLDAELVQIGKSKPILTMGNVAARLMLEDNAFSLRERGGTLHQIGDYQIIPTVHPHMLLRAGSGLGTHAPDLAFWNLVYDIRKINDLGQPEVKRTVPVFEPNIYIEYEDPQRAEALVRAVMAASLDNEEAPGTRLVALDVETTSDDPRWGSSKKPPPPYVAKLKAIGLATANFGVSVMWNLLSPAFLAEELAPWFLDETIEWIAHNKLYDLTVMHCHGFAFAGLVHDTLLAHHAAFPGGIHNLQRVISQFTIIKAWKSEFRAGEGTDAELTEYNAYDVLSTLDGHPRLQVCVKKTATEEAYKLDLTMGEIAWRMHVWGVPVSRVVNEELLQQFSANIKKHRTFIEERANNPEILDALIRRLAFERAQVKREADPLHFDERFEVRFADLQKTLAKGKWAWKIDARAHVAAYLRAVGVPLFETTKTGQTSTKKEILETLTHIPEVRSLLDYRENAKLLSTFVWRMFDRRKADGTLSYGRTDETGRLHPIWNVHRITGRWSASGPSVQNVPREDKRRGRPNLRAQVVAPEGRVIVGLDYSQLEARIIALYSGARFLLDIFAHPPTKYGPGDLHSRFATAVFPEFATADPSIKSTLRDIIKRPEYGAFYGGSEEGLWKNLVKDYPRVTLQQVAHMVRIMSKAMPEVDDWHRRLVLQASQAPNELRDCVLGRRRVFVLGNADLSEVYNFPVQAAGSAIMNQGMARMWERIHRFPGAFPILQVHDACYFEVDEDDAERLTTECHDAFTQEITRNGVTVKFPIETHIGKDWAHA